VQKFYGVLKEALDVTDASALRIWNMDKTGISSVHKPAKILATKGARSVGKVTRAEQGQTVTVLCAFNAGGVFVPPAFIYPRKRMIASLLNGAPAGSVGLCSPTGQTDGNLFLTWLKHFVAFIKCSNEEPHILLLDGHHSHKTLDAVMYAREHGLIMITFPPHCTHKLQALDLTFFKALKSNYNVAAGNWMARNPGQRISFFEMATIFNTAYKPSASVGKAVTGFDAAGIWPYNPNKYAPEDYGWAAVTEEQQPEQPMTSADTVTQASAHDLDNSTKPSVQSQPSNPVSEAALCNKVILFIYISNLFVKIMSCVDIHYTGDCQVYNLYIVWWVELLEFFNYFVHDNENYRSNCMSAWIITVCDIHQC